MLVAATIGFGIYQRSVGGDNRKTYTLLEKANWMSPKEKSDLLKIYMEESQAISKKKNKIAAITHGLIATVNIYNGSRQSNTAVKNSLFFIAGINALAALSYSF